jgi:DNA uptake protein ComE-like DNA-binding protein
MKLLDWLLLSAIISLSLAAGSFLKSVKAAETRVDLCSHAPASGYRPNHSFVCGKKIKLSEARVSDFALLEGISVKKARVLLAAVRENPELRMKDLLDVKGIGPKTLVRLEEYFEP